MKPLLQTWTISLNLIDWSMRDQISLLSSSSSSTSSHILLLLTLSFRINNLFVKFDIIVGFAFAPKIRHLSKNHEYCLFSSFLFLLSWQITIWMSIIFFERWNNWLVQRDGKSQKKHTRWIFGRNDCIADWMMDACVSFPYACVWW